MFSYWGIGWDRWRNYVQKSMHIVVGVWGGGSPLLPQAYFEYPKPMSSPFGIGIFTLGSQMHVDRLYCTSSDDSIMRIVLDWSLGSAKCLVQGLWTNHSASIHNMLMSMERDRGRTGDDNLILDLYSGVPVTLIWSLMLGGFQSPVQCWWIILGEASRWRAAASLDCVFEGQVQSLSCVWLFATPWTAACQASLSIINSRSLLKLKTIESVYLSAI